MQKIIILLAHTFLLSSCSFKSEEEQIKTKTDSTKFQHHETAHQPNHPADSTTNPFHGKTFAAEAYKNDSLGWGYVISIDGKKTINQPHIPGIPGTKGFKTKEQALRTANFVIYKIQHNMLPPSVTPEELDSLGVLE